MRECWLSARKRSGKLRAPVLAVALATSLSLATFAQSQPERLTADSKLNAILAYIHSAWDSLTRSTNSCGGVSDPKLLAAPVLYLPAGFEEPRELGQMEHGCKVTVAHLPQVIHQLGKTDADSIQPP